MGIPRNSPCPCGSGKKYKNCCFQKDFIEIPAKRKDVKFTMPGEDDVIMPIINMDSIPTHNENGIKPNITKDQMIDLCLDEIYKILKNEKVDMLVDLVNSVVHDMDIIPIFTYREIAKKIEKDNRFSIYMMQICSLSGTDPLELMTDKMS
jgi:hypothetical protein